MEQAPEGHYCEIRLDVPVRHADAVCNFIIDNLTTGMILEEEEGAEITGIIFYLAEGQHEDYRELLERYLKDILETGTELPNIREKTIKDVQWVDQYKQSVRPVLIADDIMVRPPWEKCAEGIVHDIVIEPKMAFGTGTHETTRSCVAALRPLVKPGMRVLDLGTGSGILSILADKLGATYLKAIDYDPVATDNCLENFTLNGVKAKHDVLLGSIDMCDNDEPYDIVVANIIKITILPWIPQLVALTRPGGSLILSGLLGIDEEDISAGLIEAGQSDFTIIPDNSWRTYVVRRH